MPRGGHNIKPTQQKVREGNPGHRALPPVVRMSSRVETVRDLPCPDHLDQDAVDWWEETVPLLVKAGTERIDVTVCILAATSWSEIMRCDRTLAVQGLVGTGSRGQMRGHALVRVKAEATRTYLSCCDRLGISAQARARLGISLMIGLSMQDELARTIGSGSAHWDTTAA